MDLADTAGVEVFDLVYLALSGTTTAIRCPEILRGLIKLGFATVIALPTPNASRVIAPRDLADVDESPRAGGIEPLGVVPLRQSEDADAGTEPLLGMRA
jgi:hypothetical protein